MIPKDIANELRGLVADRDRDAPIAFVGRTEEMKHLQTLVERMRQKPVKGAARIVQGAPGTGKTALCDHFQRQLVESEALRAAAALSQGQNNRVPNASVLCVHLAPADLKKSPLDFVRTISRRIDETLQSALTRIMEDKLGLSARVGGALREALGLLAQRFFRGKSWSEIRESNFGLNERSSLDDCINDYVEQAWPTNCTIALCLDEAQNCDVANAQAKDNLQALYAGQHRGRLPLFCFGLPNTMSVFERMGLSRLPSDAVRTVGCLNAGEGLQAIERALDALGLSGDNREWAAHLESLGMTVTEWDGWRAQTARELAAASGEFPQHIAIALTSWGSVLLGMDKSRSFDHPLRQEILAEHRVQRSAYYEGRFGGDALAKHRLALGAICELLHRRSAQGKTVQANEALDLLETVNDLGRPVQDGEPVLDAAVTKGVLGQDRAGLMVITAPPIQSMQTHLQDGLRAGLLDAPQVAQLLMLRVDELEPPTPNLGAHTG